MLIKRKMAIATLAVMAIAAGSSTSVFAAEAPGINGSTSATNEATFKLEGGGLSIDPNTIKGFGTLPLKADKSEYKTAFNGPVNIQDLTGTQKGWRVDVTSTQFEHKTKTGESYKLPIGSLKISPFSSIDKIGTPLAKSKMPELEQNALNVIDDGSINMAKTNEGEGMGEYNALMPKDALSIIVDPATARVDEDAAGTTNYTSTLTWNLVQAP